MSAFSQLPKNSEGSVVDKFALVCAVISVACVFGANALDKLAKNGDLPVVSFNRGAHYPGVDYSATASIPNRASSTNLNPCVQNTPAR